MAEGADVQGTAADDPLREAEDGGRDLTPRQTQILALLQAGKANKEIATELGIGLGTVKQHMNVLFKKLDVSNRTMAVSRGFGRSASSPGTLPGPLQGSTDAPALMVIDRQPPEMRPATVLSVSLPQPTLDHLASQGSGDGGSEHDDAGHPLHRALASVASEFGAVFVARADGGDLIFGVQRCLEQDVLRAVRAAFAAARGRRLHPVIDALRAGIDSGVISVGFTAHGTWDGEINAGTLLHRTRGLAAEAAPRTLAVGPDAARLIALLCGTPQDGAESPLTSIDLGDDFTFTYCVPPVVGGLRGRAHEVGILEHDAQAMVDGIGRAVLIEGEAGIGKSAVLATLPGLCNRFRLTLETWRCLPPDGQPLSPARGYLTNVADGTTVDASFLAERINAAGDDLAQVIGLDDVHWLPPDSISGLFDAATAAAAKGRLVVITARPVVSASVGGIRGGRQLRLGRLERRALEALVDGVAESPLRREAKAAICDRAAGVPLFAEQLVRAVNGGGSLPLQPPLPVLSLLVARLDGLHLDRRLLRLIADRAGVRRLDALQEGWPGTTEEFTAAVRAATAAGLLRRTEKPEPTVATGHPMIQSILGYVMTPGQFLGGRP